MEEEEKPAEKYKKEQSVRRQEKEEDVVYCAPQTQNALISKESSVLSNADERQKEMKFKS